MRALERLAYHQDNTPRRHLRPPNGSVGGEQHGIPGFHGLWYIWVPNHASDLIRAYP